MNKTTQKIFTYYLPKNQTHGKIKQIRTLPTFVPRTRNY